MFDSYIYIFIVIRLCQGAIGEIIFKLANGLVTYSIGYGQVSSVVRVEDPNVVLKRLPLHLCFKRLPGS